MLSNVSANGNEKNDRKRKKKVNNYLDEEFTEYYWLDINTGDMGKDIMYGYDIRGKPNVITPRDIIRLNEQDNGYIYSLIPIKDAIMARLVGL